LALFATKTFKPNAQETAQETKKRFDLEFHFYPVWGAPFLQKKVNIVLSECQFTVFTFVPLTSACSTCQREKSRP
jgi:hypothetical protein